MKAQRHECLGGERDIGTERDQPLHSHCCSSETRDQCEPRALILHGVPPRTGKSDIIILYLHIFIKITHN